MSEHALPLLVARVAAIIHGTFDVTPEIANDHALGFVALAEGWGTPESAAKLNWSYRVKKDLGEKLRWRSDADRKEFYAEKDQWCKDYNVLIGGDNKRPMI